MATIPPEKAPRPGLTIYGGAVVNPAKLAIAAEELGVPYHYITLNLINNDAHSAWYTTHINPNGKIPALVHLKADGSRVTVFESAACLLYLAAEFDTAHKISYPVTDSRYWDQLSWLSWQIASYGPMMGQAAHFNRYAVSHQPYGIWRYTAESRRLHSVLDERLAESEFVTGDKLTIADIAVFIYAHSAAWCGIDLAEYKNVQKWHDKLAARPAFQRGLDVPEPYLFSDEAVSDVKREEKYRMMRKGGAKFIMEATQMWAGEAVALPSDHANYEDPQDGKGEKADAVDETV